MPYHRIEAALFDRPWALMPSKMEAVCEVVARRLAGDDALPDGFVPSLGSDAATTQEGVRVIPVRGVMGKRMNMMSMGSGGVSTEQLGQEIQSAVADPSISGILLDIDSPGGSVDGAFALADLVYASRGVKPIVAFADGCAASAAYLLASAADHIVANETADVGSIGVIAAHTDTSERDAKEGVKHEYITAGKYKASGRDGAPLDKEGRAMIQEQLDQLYSLFVEKVARNRGVSAAVVATDMADGRIFIGESARAHGLVDEIGERGAALGAVLSASHSNTQFNLRGASASSTGPRGKGEATMPTVMDAIRLVLEGNGDDADEKDRETAQAIVSLCFDKFAETQTAEDELETEAESEATVDPVEQEVDATATIDEKAIRAQERDRIFSINKACEALGLSAEYAAQLVSRDVSLQTALEAATLEAAQRQEALVAATGEQQDPLTATKTNDRSEKAVAAVSAYMVEHNVDFRTAALAVQGKGN